MPAGNESANPIMWEVVSQQPAQGKGPSGAYGPGHQVTGRLVGTGSTFSVFIPNDNYTVEGVRAAMQSKAEAVAAVDGLTGRVAGR